MRTARGHRSVPHTADVILEAWGTDLASCCEEAVAALVDTYIAAVRGPVVDERTVDLRPARDEELLLRVLDEVIFTLDTEESVPVNARVSEDGAAEVTIGLVGREAVDPTGAVPKAVSRSGLRVTAGPGRVSCRFLVDL